MLEPIVNLEVYVPDAHMGDVTGGLASKRARINGTDSLRGGEIIIKAQVPLAEVTDYQTELKALTAGQGRYAIEFSHYEPVPAQVQKQLMDAYKPKVEDWTKGFACIHRAPGRHGLWLLPEEAAQQTDKDCDELFFYGQDMGEEFSVDIEAGKTLIIKLTVRRKPHADGTRTNDFRAQRSAAGRERRGALRSSHRWQR